MLLSETICALSTPVGVGGIAVIRVSGPAAFQTVDAVLDRSLSHAQGYSAHFARVMDESQIIDEVVAVVFRGPYSYTGEDTVEISVHGSLYIQQRTLELLQQSGARMATPGEYTMRAYLNGKLDLSQAEAVADLIAGESAAMHQQAMHQMRGGFSKEINQLREQLIQFAALMELELDFAEEDVEFADRTKFQKLLDEIEAVVRHLIDSFALGNALRNGIPVAIIGAPNAGKSTLLNALLNEDRAIVSEIPGTTRDTVEDQMVIAGVRFHFIDTAGIRATEDEIEKLGIARSLSKAQSAQLVICLADMHQTTTEQMDTFIREVQTSAGNDKIYLRVWNKVDPDTERLFGDGDIAISAKFGVGIEELKSAIAEATQINRIQSGETVVTNARHHAALQSALEALLSVRSGMQTNASTDFLAVDIRKTLYHLGEIVGKVQADDLLNHIFSKFCIGK
jgi:tRNA modification GTPase